MADKIKLSEAIRIGSKLRPQAFMALYEDGDTCAQGAAYEAVFGPIDPKEYGNGNDYYRRLHEYFPELKDSMARTSPTACLLPLKDCLYTLNDVQRQPREEIADWVESIGY